ncbi:MAG: hypothetical protein A2283_16740 [Lentisphaerae bacterium RIFOXYA12_FULL_48_11]|nr:MAG: hypothetical protein A2283_16740 [Lentisphaerae bacterium RIFOXYA12_FULL_48_11]
MKKVVIGLMCAGLVLSLTASIASAAKTTGRTSKKSVQKDDMQSQEASMLGVVELKDIKDKDGKVIQKAFFLVDSKGKEWKLPPSSKVKNYAIFEGLKVKLTGMQLGSGSLVSVKSMDAIDKAAFEAKQAEIKAAADAKKAAAQKK